MYKWSIQNEHPYSTPTQIELLHVISPCNISCLLARILLINCLFPLIFYINDSSARTYVCIFVSLSLNKYSNKMHANIVAVAAEIPFDTYTAFVCHLLPTYLLLYIVCRHTSKIKPVEAAEVSSKFVVWSQTHTSQQRHITLHQYRCVLILQIQLLIWFIVCLGALQVLLVKAPQTPFLLY